MSRANYAWVGASSYLSRVMVGKESTLGCELTGQYFRRSFPFCPGFKRRSCPLVTPNGWIGRSIKLSTDSPKSAGGFLRWLKEPFVTMGTHPNRLAANCGRSRWIPPDPRVLDDPARAFVSGAGCAFPQATGIAGLDMARAKMGPMETSALGGGNHRASRRETRLHSRHPSNECERRAP
jgi:hypothetical protein